MLIEKMTLTERRAVMGLSAVMGLRMVGLFMVLPIFTLYAQQLSGATSALIGIAMGIYGLSQALCQIPFGSLSDRFGRKPIILIGLGIFIGGSIIAGFSTSIIGLIIGRTLQGAGAIGSTILAMMADLTREHQRTKSMAIAGITIGFSFSLAMLLGPLLANGFSSNALFWIAASMGVLAIIILYTAVPTPTHSEWHRDTEPELKSFFTLLLHPELAKLNSGIFILHAIFTASFMAIPITLYQFAALPANRQWTLYLPTLAIACVASLLMIGLAERKQQLKSYFLIGIIMLSIAQLMLWLSPFYLFSLLIGLSLFFTGFSLLEAFLPSMISRAAPASRKGSALGIFSCAQFLGIFVGGVFGGWLYGQYHFSGVYLFCVFLSFIWLIIAYRMKTPRYLVTQLWPLPHVTSQEWHAIATKLHVIPGIVEVTFIAEDKMAYLKMERSTVKHPDFLHLKQHTIGII